MSPQSSLKPPPEQPELERVYTFIVTYIHEHATNPSLREIAAGCYLGRSTTYRFLDKLEAQGRILREPGQARSIRLPKPPSDN
jgi:DNA-binding IclR family transcriptional regulator